MLHKARASLTYIGPQSQMQVIIYIAVFQIYLRTFRIIMSVYVDTSEVDT